MAKTGHNHQVDVNLQTQRHEAIKHWRAGLAEARDVYRQWEAGPRDKDSPNAVGDEWFEGLRPHLPTTGEAAKFRTAHQVNGDNATLMMLSLAIDSQQLGVPDRPHGGRAGNVTHDRLRCASQPRRAQSSIAV